MEWGFFIIFLRGIYGRTGLRIIFWNNFEIGDGRESLKQEGREYEKIGFAFVGRFFNDPAIGGS